MEGAVFLDLGKSFDTVNDAVLIANTTQYKPHMDTFSWLKSYLGGTPSVSIQMMQCDNWECAPWGHHRDPFWGRCCLASISITSHLCGKMLMSKCTLTTVNYVHGKDSEQVAAKLSVAKAKFATAFFSSKQQSKTLPHHHCYGRKNYNCR